MGVLSNSCSSDFSGFVLIIHQLNLLSGLMTALHRDYFRVLNYRELLFNDFGDRVAQLLHVESVVPFWQSRHRNIQQEVLIVNTHLLFPHDYRLCFVRLHQVDLFPIFSSQAI